MRKSYEEKHRTKVSEGDSDDSMINSHKKMSCYQSYDTVYIAIQKYKILVLRMFKPEYCVKNDIIKYANHY